MSSANVYSAALKERMTSMASSLQDVFDGGEQFLTREGSHNFLFVWCKYIQMISSVWEQKQQQWIYSNLKYSEWHLTIKPEYFIHLTLKLMFISLTIFPESSSSNSSPDVKRKDYGKMILPLKRGNDIIYPLCKQGGETTITYFTLNSVESLGSATRGRSQARGRTQHVHNQQSDFDVPSNELCHWLKCSNRGV